MDEILNQFKILLEKRVSQLQKFSERDNSSFTDEQNKVFENTIEKENIFLQQLHDIFNSIIQKKDNANSYKEQSPEYYYKLGIMQGERNCNDENWQKYFENENEKFMTKKNYGDLQYQKGYHRGYNECIREHGLCYKPISIKEIIENNLFIQ